jgi:hypothetical protein
MARPDGSVYLVDLGPASARGHVHDGGRLASGEVVRGQSGESVDWASKERRRLLNARRPTTRAGRRGVA